VTNTSAKIRPSKLPKLSLLIFLGFLHGLSSAGQTPTPPTTKGGIAEITASGPQRRDGDLYIADKDVNVVYQGMHLQADHVEYSDQTNMAKARGHVVFDYENQHLEGDEGELNVATGKGVFLNVRGSIHLNRRPNPLVLVTENPLYFEGKQVDRVSEDVYVVHHGWFTVCEPTRTIGSTVCRCSGCHTARRRPGPICGNPVFCCRSWATATRTA
jgi:lipopolysaccharide assembly outer membrane protein LptD (OstA)